jgi:hypothetical protein
MSSKPQCHYVLPKGALCGSPAMRGHLHCYFHHQAELRARRRVRLGGPHSTGLDFGTLEDATTIQNAIADIMHHLADRIIDRATAATLLYALQLAITNHQNVRTEARPDEVPVGELTSSDDNFDRIPVEDTAPARRASGKTSRCSTKPAAPEIPGDRLTRVMSVYPEDAATRPPAGLKPPKKPSAPARLSRPQDIADPELRKIVFGVPEKGVPDIRASAASNNSNRPITLDESAVDRDIALAKSGDLSAAHRLLAIMSLRR